MTTQDAPVEDTPDPDLHGILAEDQAEVDEWVEDTSGPGLLPRMAAELVGTFILVFMGVGTALYFSTGDNGTLAVAFGFALGVLIAALIFGGVSGAHLNPAVTFGLWVAGRFPGRDVASYWLAQVVGAACAAGILFLTASMHPESGDAARALISTASNGYGDHSPTGFGWGAGMIIEIIIATLLVGVVLAVTSVFAKDGAAAAPFAIGLTVGFLVLIAIPFTNGALNPARALGTALWSDTWALQQVWLFWIAPLIGAAIAGLLYRALGPTEDLIAVERIEETVVVVEN
ncbi:MIP family channel protein [Demequina sediminicola]|uniref:MIP family channel protein n=1 Tax=Demequina sediminicola TaxID=1095026 RepID=UPI000B2F71AD|nr:MIP family channel protein [Demequina sediminicola]